MNILLLNQNWFAEELKAQGHDVMVVGFGRDFEVRYVMRPLHIDTVIKLLPRKFIPDCIIAYDESSPLMISGLESCNIPTLFYSVDTHHHAHLHRWIAQMFDCTLIAQRDYAHMFEAQGISPIWMPLWASRFVEATPERRHEVCFIGNMDLKLNPERVAFFGELKKHIPIHITQGKYWEFFPYSEVVVNQTVKGDLNFRVFEALMCGTLLLTERSGNGLNDLFQDQVHCLTYEKNNVTDAVEKVSWALADLPRARSIAQAGRDNILSKHLPQHRADFLISHLQGLKKKKNPVPYFGSMANFSSLARNVEKYDTGMSGRCLVQALKSAETGLLNKEPLNSELACHLVRSAILYDQLLFLTAGNELLNKFAEAYPNVPVLKLAQLRRMLNKGERVNAEKLAQQISEQEISLVFKIAEEVISQVLER